MAASDMMSALMELCQEKPIDQLYLIDRLEQSLAKSYAEILHLEWGAKVTIDRTTGKIYVYRLEPIDDSMDEEGNFTEFEEIDVPPKNTSRIAAQHAKAEINAIVRNFNGGPVGLNNLAAMVGEESETVETVCEPYLVREGFMIRTPKGRVATEKAWQHLGITPKDDVSKLF